MHCTCDKCIQFVIKYFYRIKSSSLFSFCETIDHIIIHLEDVLGLISFVNSFLIIKANVLSGVEDKKSENELHVLYTIDTYRTVH